MDLPVDEERLRADVEATAEFGAIDAPEGRGRTVLAGTEANREAREYFVERLDDAGLDVRIDGVGNVAGRWELESAEPDAPAVAAGSHLDSVVEGGIFDGPLGTYAALEAVRAMQDAEVESLRKPIEVVCFTEEEGGRFASGLLGSSVAAGVRSAADALALTDSDGVTLDDALEDIGYRGEGRLNAGEWDAWLELHIEQGTRLESMGKEVGIVTTVTGITHCDVTIAGETDHAGTTPMGTRTDALAAASELIADVERAGRRAAGIGVDADADYSSGDETERRNADAETDADADEDTETDVDMDAESDANDDSDAGDDRDDEGRAVATVGRIDARPNATNVVPGRVDLGIDIRDVTREPIERVVNAVEASLARLETERGVETTLARPLDVPPTPMAERCQGVLRRQSNETAISSTAFHSGAAHDTMHVARVTDASMLFAPSRGGYSHSPREWTDWADCAAATRVLAGALADLAGV